MLANPVFVNELRQSPFRRQPVLWVAVWSAITALLIWLTQFAPDSYSLSIVPLFVLPLIVPAFSAGAFAKEYEQQTWQDLYLTRLTNLEVVLGKFFAALVQIGLMLLVFLPAILLQGYQWAFASGWWALAVVFKLTISASMYVLLAMVCSRYSGSRRVALVWSYVAMFLYAMLGYALWSAVGQDVERANAYLNNNSTVRNAVGSPFYAPDPRADPFAPGFMQGMHLIFCSVVGVGTVLLLWVSLSEQRGYKGTANATDSKRAWQPIPSRRFSDPSPD